MDLLKERKHGGVSLIARTVIKINLPHCVIVFHQLSGRPPVPFVLLLADALFLCLFLGTASGGGSAGGSTGLTSARSATPLFFGLVAFFCFPDDAPPFAVGAGVGAGGTARGRFGTVTDRGMNAALVARSAVAEGGGGDDAAVAAGAVASPRPPPSSPPSALSPAFPRFRPPRPRPLPPRPDRPPAVSPPSPSFGVCPIVPKRATPAGSGHARAMATSLKRHCIYF